MARLLLGWEPLLAAMGTVYFTALLGSALCRLTELYRGEERGGEPLKFPCLVGT